MRLSDMQAYLPTRWHPMNVNCKYQAFPLSKNSDDYIRLRDTVTASMKVEVDSIYQIQNPLAYMKYTFRMVQYEQAGPYEVMKLFHDSDYANAESISTYNFDWRFGERFKFGPGVYFSPTPALANRFSNRLNGEKRAMFFVDVLVGRTQMVEDEDEVVLPDVGYDTVVSRRNTTFVKYFDNEFYPAYVAFYWWTS